MVEYLIIYLIFAAATAATSLITIIIPVIDKISVVKPFNDIAQSPILAQFVFFVVGLLVAPLILIPSIVPAYNKTFQDSLFTTLTE